MLFANLEEMLEIHGQFNAALKRKRKEAPLIGDIGPVLLETVCTLTHALPDLGLVCLANSYIKLSNLV
jgi:hypothetical protein